MKEHLTSTEAARALGVSVETLRRWDRAGRIETRRDSANRRLVPRGEVERLRGRERDDLSARNRLRGVVRDVQIEGLLAQVEIDVTGPARVVAIITREAAEALDLAARQRGQRRREGDLGHGGAVRRAALVAALAAAVAGGLPAGGQAGGQRLTIFAAASLTEVFGRIDGGQTYNFAGSNQLAFQIRQGARADVYASASPEFTQDLFRAGLVERPRLLVTNRLVLIVPRSNPAGLRIVYDLRRKDVKLVIGGARVPVGTYTRQVLRRLGLTSRAGQGRERGARRKGHRGEGRARLRPTPASCTRPTRASRRRACARSRSHSGPSRRCATRSPSYARAGAGRLHAPG